MKRRKNSGKEGSNQNDQLNLKSFLIKKKCQTRTSQSLNNSNRKENKNMHTNTGRYPRECSLKAEYLLTSYVSTSAMKPSGKAIAKETIAANSPSLDSSVEMSRILDSWTRWWMARSNRSRLSPLWSEEKKTIHDRHGIQRGSRLATYRFPCAPVHVSSAPQCR